MEGTATDITRRPGFQVIYKLEPGEQYKFWNGCIIVAHPDRPPKIVHSDGTTEIIQPFTGEHTGT